MTMAGVTGAMLKVLVWIVFAVVVVWPVLLAGFFTGKLLFGS